VRKLTKAKAERVLAEKVMGWRKEDTWRDYSDYWHPFSRAGNAKMVQAALMSSPHHFVYYAQIADEYAEVEFADPVNAVREKGKRSTPVWQACEKTEAEAICVAALKWALGEREIEIVNEHQE